MVCPNCGARQADGARFCENCGTRLVSSRPSAQEDAFYGYAGGTPRLAPGYSRKLDSEPVLAALKKQRRAVRIAAVVLVVLPLVGFLIYGALSSAMDMGQALFTGVIVSAVFALATLITLIKQKLARSFEGTVIDKKHIRRIGRSTRAGRRSRSRWRVTIEGEDGKRRKKDVTPTVFEYLKVGDRVRFLPQFPQPIEKYDKSGDAEIPCMFCGRMNSVANDMCMSCHNPMIK